MTTLWAIVDKDGNEVGDNRWYCKTEDDAWGQVVLQLFILSSARRRDKIASALSDGYRAVQLHTYNPDTHGVYEKAKQVVIDREVYIDICGVIEQAIELSGADAETDILFEYGTRGMVTLDAGMRFLSAGEKK